MKNDQEIQRDIWLWINDISKYTIMDEYAYDENGLITNPGKWKNEPIYSKIMWDLSLCQSISGIEEWDHVSLGYWIHVPINEAMRRLFGFEKTDIYVEIHEADNGFMYTTILSKKGSQARNRKKELNNLCYGES